MVFCFSVPPLNLDQRQLVLPSLLRFGQNSLEILGARFRFQVGPGVFDADIGNRQLERDDLRLVRRLRSSGQRRHGRPQRCSGWGKPFALPGAEGGKGWSEPGGKIHLDAAISPGKSPERPH